MKRSVTVDMDALFEDLFKKTLEEEMSEPKNKSKLYDDIVNYYFMLLSLLKIDSFNSFHFHDYEDYRRVNVDEVEYDFSSKVKGIVFIAFLTK